MDLPSGGDVVGKGRSRPDLSGQTEITQLDHFGTVAQNVLRLEIAVKETVLVHVSQALQNLDDDLLQSRFR